ncbi:ankyrin repeat domain-containing protein [Costertonia aggregata]|uniref:Ankyrin repeat domain-containing protein n=1 Tax=Costertonia aggregata TaxID=343403 RepID=A0A7H9AS40_9FLAO|nr:ankyrin repeat domain-containing protein [Costertonia aggregata]QLG46005.1 ankyrin repeat domain-containing protein [Costertonia aggregata]
MFWNEKPKLPITSKDQTWVEESLSFLKDSLGEDRLRAVKTVEPTKEFFNRDFDGEESDAQFILQRCKELMDIQKKVSLEFYSEESRYLDDGTLLSSSMDIMGRSSRAAGTYQKKGGKSLIRIERGQLKRPESLIATISHELAHEKLLGEHRIIQNDEYLTDLTAIVFGFGIFIANAKFQLTSGIQNGFGWQMQSQGYLPEQVTAYAMASLALKKKENDPAYKMYFDSSVAKYFEQALRYLTSDENPVDVTSFWTFKEQVEEIKKSQPIVKPERDGIFDASDLERLRREMQHACYQGNNGSVENLLQKGVSPNFVIIGGSPLTIAVKQENKELIDCLLRYAADINFSETENIMDSLPLMAACENENIAMMKYLIDLGAEINRVAGNGQSVLEVAVETGNVELVAFLLKFGAWIEIKSGHFMIFDKTPLTVAVLNNDTQMVCFLVENGAKTKPIRKIERHKIHPKMVKFLKTKKYL